MVTSFIDRSVPLIESFSTPSRAHLLTGSQRKELAVEVLTRNESVSSLAKQNQVSRKFLYQQAGQAANALEQAFTPPEESGETVLFSLPATPSWIKQFVLAQVLIGHTSFRGVQELLQTLFNHSISIGTVHNIVHKACDQARILNATESLDTIRHAALDEIFQAGLPVLAGVDVRSTYCFLLAHERHRDETTWGVHLMDLTQKGLNPDFTIADFGTGLRAGQKAAWSNTPCHGDVFHAEQELTRLATYLEHRAFGAINACEKLERKMERAKKAKKGQMHAKRLAQARSGMERAMLLADDIRVLEQWVRQDVLAIAGPSLVHRRELFDFVVEQLAQRESLCSHRIAPVRRLLENHREQLLGFVGVIDQRFKELAIQFEVSVDLVQALSELKTLDPHQPLRWERQTKLQAQLGSRYHDLCKAVETILKSTPRASSLVENLNSRLRNYFFLRRHINSDYLELLRFFLNHRPLIRSERPERVGKTPYQLLIGQAHPHWLELLGFQRAQLN